MERFVKTFPVRIFQYVQGSCQRRKHGKQHERLCVWGVSEGIYIVTMFGSHFRLSEVSKYVLFPFFFKSEVCTCVFSQMTAHIFGCLPHFGVYISHPSRMANLNSMFLFLVEICKAVNFRRCGPATVQI